MGEGLCLYHFSCIKAYNDNNLKKMHVRNESVGAFTMPGKDIEELFELALIN